MQTNTSFGLTMIMKDEVADLRRILSDYAQYFDAIYLTVTHRPTYDALLKETWLAEFGTKLHMDFLEWHNNFGQARLHNQKQVETDYWMWLDLDDELENPEALESIVNYMQAKKLDMVMLQYDYFQENNVSTSVQWRERIVSKKSGFTWSSDAVHEQIETPYGARFEQLSDVTIRHRKTQQQVDASVQRNTAILLEAWQKNPDAHTAYYLGRTYRNQDPLAAIDYLLFAAQNASEPDRQLECWIILARCLLELARYEEAIVATDKAINIDPTHPEPWYQKVEIYYAQATFDKAYEFSKIAHTKLPTLGHMHGIDPARYAYPATFQCAIAALRAGMTQEAYSLFQEVEAQNPDYVDAQSRPWLNWRSLFTEAFTVASAIENTIALDDYLTEQGRDRAELYAALPSQVFNQAPMRARRNAVTGPKKWPNRSIAYFVGEGPEPWGPENLEQGIGGSEEAVILLSRELAKKGWQITVFCERSTNTQEKVTGANHAIHYVPWQTLNVEDEFDVFISSRHPGAVHNLNARKLIAELHDACEEKLLLSVAHEVDQFVVRSQWHRQQYSNVADNKITVIGNGIDMAAFKKLPAKKRPFSAGYFSSYQRGLEMLLLLWPKIKEKVPQATLDIYYGWEVFDRSYDTNPAKDRFKLRMLQLIASLADAGVTDHGRVSQAKLAKAMKNTAVWLYPTEFAEVFCITAVKTAYSGMHQVTTQIAALPETAPGATFVGELNIYINSAAQAEFVQKAADALLAPKPSPKMSDADWASKAREWDELLS